MKCPDCEEVKENVSALFDGELSPDEAEAVVKRIKKCAEGGCGECMQLYDDLKKMGHVIKSPENNTCPPEDIIANLRSRVMIILKNTQQ